MSLGKEAVAAAQPATTSASCKLPNEDKKNGNNGNVNSPRNNAGVKAKSTGTRCPMGNSEVPDAFCCPIGLDIMSDPVFLIETGHTFERHLIEAHLQRSDLGPLCGVQLKSKTLKPNYALRQAIEAYLSDRGQAPGRSAPPPPSPPSAAAVAGQCVRGVHATDEKS